MTPNQQHTSFSPILGPSPILQEGSRAQIWVPGLYLPFISAPPALYGGGGSARGTLLPPAPVPLRAFQLLAELPPVLGAEIPVPSAAWKCCRGCACSWNSLPVVQQSAAGNSASLARCSEQSCAATGFPRAQPLDFGRGVPFSFVSPRSSVLNHPLASFVFALPLPFLALGMEPSARILRGGHGFGLPVGFAPLARGFGCIPVPVPAPG